MAIDIFVTPDAESAAAAAAALLVEAAAAGGSIVLAGGSTPRRAYELAAELHSDWGDAEIWFGDDLRATPARKMRSAHTPCQSWAASLRITTKELNVLIRNISAATQATSSPSDLAPKFVSRRAVINPRQMPRRFVEALRMWG